jgi:REP element-mobilizing transposase RayT
MPQSFACLHHHLIFSTRNRAPLLDSDLLPRLFQYIGGILHTEGCALVAAGGMPDHVHLLVSLKRDIAVADALRVIKSTSSKWIHETEPTRGAFAWQAGYGAFAVSFSHLDRVKAYLAGQAEHHRTVTFQEEFRAFLVRHQIVFDEQYLWD